MEPAEPESAVETVEATRRAEFRAELGACFWAALHAVGSFLAMIAIVPSDLLETWFILLCAAIAWAASVRFGFAAAPPPGRSKAARVFRVGFLGAPTGFLVLAVWAGALDRERGWPMALLGALLVALAQRRKQTRGRERPRRTRMVEAAAWLCALALPVGLDLLSERCVSIWLKYGLVVAECPDGHLVPTVTLQASGLRRGGPGEVVVTTVVHFAGATSDQGLEAYVEDIKPELVLLAAGGKQVPLKPERSGWLSRGFDVSGAIVLPKDLPDGDYRLRASVETRFGAASVEAPLALYAPARIHVITDRPLYEPGNLVQFRAVVLRATDLAPLDGRPGRWEVRDPSGEVVLEEVAAAGNYGVVAGSFPLDEHAEPGSWRVRWVSSEAYDEVSIRVEPFQLPRFRVEATPARPFYGKGERPILRGRVLYSSGAPVDAAELALAWQVRAEPLREGAWPAPSDWESGALPVKVQADAAGAFELELPEVPNDLRGQVQLVALIAAVDGAGDRVTAKATVLLSADPIKVEAQTELEGGLVEGFNNRLYLRATSADGQLLRGARLHVRRAWEADDPGVDAVTDSQGVAALQIDPGPAVNVVLAPMPVRQLARSGASVEVERADASELVSGEGASLADQRVMDAWNAVLEPCGRYVGDDAVVRTTHLRVNGAGSVIAAVPGEDDRLGSCIAAAISRGRFPAGAERLYDVTHAIASKLPGFEYESNASGEAPAELEAALDDALAEARPCLPLDTVGGSLPRILTWTPNVAAKTEQLSFVADPEQAEADDGVPAAIASCIERKVLAGLNWSRDVQPPKEWVASLGYARIRVKSGDTEAAPVQQSPTTLLGYELAVSAHQGGEALGETSIVLDQGRVPTLRLRADPVLAAPGDRVAVQVLRGPDFTGELAEELVMTHRHGELKAHLDRSDHTARFKLPSDAKGWFEVRYDQARALVFVRGASDLAVEIKPGEERYAPGDMAELIIRTAEGGVPAAAGVGLFGVDQSLAQLATLSGPDDMARLRVLPTMRGRALGDLDAAALEMGRVQGPNAAAAAILQIGDLPTVESTDAVASAVGEGDFDPVAVLTDSFYRVFAELQYQVRDWEKSAPKSEKMRPPTMVKLWQAALTACQARKEPVEDIFGRSLALHQLPEDLLALVDPRALIIDGTRLPEDVENWQAWVSRERP